MNSVRPEIVELVFQVRKKKRYIHRDREESHYQLMKDYFNENYTYPPGVLLQAIQDATRTFLRILNDVKAYDDYFVQKKDTTSRLGLSSIQKMTTVVCILAYGCAADHCDEYIKIGESTAIKCLKVFCNAIVAVYAEEYMCPPNEADIAWLFEEDEQRGFPVFNGIVNDQLPSVNYVVNEYHYRMWYYLSEGIYFKWTTMMQTISHPTTIKEKLFAQRQEACRKDMEWAFGVLQIKWATMQGPVRYWEKDDLGLIMKTCIILHNMIIEDECYANVGR
ncbi:uncharacterized protein LOC132282019 [Cornus florida]|uniref:uncharacterized protein LOC132282019 n=1 Tax=Cornus florida TaxID=4283 RepID=UPI002897F504|nr:uncharacterized protein LOC132282019 [Cornus florida]